MITATFALIVTMFPGPMDSPGLVDFKMEYSDVYSSQFQTVQECRDHMRSIGEDLVVGLDQEGIRATFEFKCS